MDPLRNALWSRVFYMEIKLRNTERQPNWEIANEQSECTSSPESRIKFTSQRPSSKVTHEAQPTLVQLGREVAHV
jgi:hypothetical protein